MPRLRGGRERGREGTYTRRAALSLGGRLSVTSSISVVVVKGNGISTKSA